MKQLGQTMKRSTVTKMATQNQDLLRIESYDQLMNLRTTLLHMQYLYASLSQTLQIQHINQQNQHKDHLIQCFNLRQQLEQLRKHNFTKLFIVKLQQLLVIEETCNQYLMAQPEINSKTQYQHKKRSSVLQQNQIDLVPKIQKLVTFAKIQEEQLQNSLCKLYVGNKVMLDLTKTSQSILKIQEKIDTFLGKHNQTIKLYNQKLKDFEQVQGTYKNYLALVSPKITELNRKDCYKPNQQNQDKNFEISYSKSFLYQAHIKNKLIEQQKSLQIRLNAAKNKLLLYG